jgi:hypothetical protein
MSTVTKNKVLHWLPIALVTSVLLLLMAPAGAFAASANNLVTQITLTTPTPNLLQIGQHVDLSFKYNTNEPGGVLIWARPFTHGALTPSYEAHGSNVHSVGTGTGTGWFTIASGNVTVDQIRIQMWNTAQTTLLYEGFIPVNYRFTSVTGNVVNKLVMTRTPNVLKQKQRAKVGFTFSTTKAAGVRITAQPLTNGKPTRHYAANASPLYAAGTHNGAAWFTVTSGVTTVTQVRVTMWNKAKTKVLFRATVPVSYRFAKPTNVTNSITLTPRSPNVLRFGENISLTFKYRTSDADGVMIFARPITNGAPTPGYGAHGSTLYPVGTGNATGWFTITDGIGTVVVDHIRIQMYNHDQSKLLSQVQIPVTYQYK